MEAGLGKNWRTRIGAGSLVIDGTVLFRETRLPQGAMSVHSTIGRAGCGVPVSDVRGSRRLTVSCAALPVATAHRGWEAAHSEVDAAVSLRSTSNASESTSLRFAAVIDIAAAPLASRRVAAADRAATSARSAPVVPGACANPTRDDGATTIRTFTVACAWVG